MKKISLIISRCLLGEPCRYDGKSNKKEDLKELNDVLLKYEEYIELFGVCPEEDGGLSTPRPPAEIIDGCIINSEGVDVTAEYNRGAELALKKAIEKDIDFAILKARSPSCGCNGIYDGTFTKTLIEGKGVTAKLLRENKFVVFSEEEIDKIENKLKFNINAEIESRKE